MTSTASAITAEEALALFRRACAGRDELAENARVLGEKRGSINQIFHIEANGKQFALRLRYNERHFQYEKGVFKEVVAALLFSACDEGNVGGAGRELGDAWGRIAGSRSGALICFACGADIIYFDFTGSDYAGPWAVLEWTGEALGADFGPAHAFHLGQIVSNIHRLRFQHAYRTFQDIRPRGVDIFNEWQEEIVRRNNNTACIVGPEAALRRKLDGLAAESRALNPQFVLCHNDLHCLNVTQKQGSLYLVDWDNAQIAPKELDFVKFAHWSRLGADGHFEPDSAIFASFCAGYGAGAGAVLASPIFKLAEVVWLFRVLEFASVLNGPANPPFWAPRRYASLLRERLADI
jgi:hypothetical protein